MFSKEVGEFVTLQLAKQKAEKAAQGAEHYAAQASLKAKQARSASNAITNFRFFEKMPIATLGLINKFQTLRESYITSPLISRYFHENMKHPLAWNYLGKLTHDKFAKRIKKLPLNFQKLILSEVEPYTLSFSEQAFFLEASPVERLMAVYPNAALIDAYKNFMSTGDLGDELVRSLTPSGEETWHTLGQMVTYCNRLMRCVEMEHCFIALLEEQIDFAEVLRVSDNKIKLIFKNNHGLIGLRESLFTLDDLANLSIPVIELLLSSGGLVAMRNKFHIDFTWGYDKFKSELEAFLTSLESFTPTPVT